MGCAAVEKVLALKSSAARVRAGDLVHPDPDFINHTRNVSREYPPLPEALQDIVALGGNAGWLKRWRAGRRQKA